MCGVELTDLKIFVTVAEYASVTKTAKALAMTQPGVSQHLARLENELGYKLFDRIGKKIEINDTGRIFYGKAKKLLEDAEQLKLAMKGEAVPVGSLKLGLTDSASHTVIPPALSRFKKEFPYVKVSLDVSDSGEIENGILRGHYELGVVTSGLSPHPMLDERILYYDRLDAIVSRHHPLAKRRRVSLDELAKWPLLVYPRRSRTRLIIDEAFYSRNIHPREIMDIYFNSGAARLAEAGIGVAILSKAFIMSEMAKHKCVHLRIEGDPFERAICVVRKRDSHFSDAARIFYDILTKQKKK